LPLLDQLLIVSSPAMPRSCSSIGMVICDSISLGLAARQLACIESCGRSILGNSWIGVVKMETIPIRAISASPAAIAAG